MSYDQFDQYASWLPECNGYPAPVRVPESLDYIRINRGTYLTGTFPQVPL